MKNIQLNLTQAEYDAMLSMIQDNAIMIGTSGDEFAIPTMKHIKIFNKALKRNGVDDIINY